jgi:hypothetical protein
VNPFRRSPRRQISRIGLVIIERVAVLLAGAV